MDSQELATRVELALANAKRGRREFNIVITELARLRDLIEQDSHSKGETEQNGTSTEAQAV